MKNISLKLRDDIFGDVEMIVKKVRKSRNAYINDAVSFYNQLNKRRGLKEQLLKESEAVRISSLEVLSEFEKLEDSLPS